MKKIIFLSTFSSLIGMSLFFSCHQKTQDPEKEIRRRISNQVDSFTQVSLQLKNAVDLDSSEAQIQNIFLLARIAFKKIEWAVEYFDPATTRVVNGPPNIEVEVSGQVLEPAGLQVIEGYIFPSYDHDKKRMLATELYKLQESCARYKSRFDRIDVLSWQIFDAVKLEVFRIETLGITGFDNPLTHQSMQESEAALESVRFVMQFYDDEKSTVQLPAKIDAASGYLHSNPDFNTFNRMVFIRDYCNPLTTAITTLRNELNIRLVKYNRLLNQEANTLFDTNAFNVNAFAPDVSAFVSPEKIKLGERLFSDPILSGTGMRSCRSCHQPEKMFTDGLEKNTVIGESALLGRNTPTLINAALQPALFYDLRVNTLEEQSHSVVQSAKEMHGSMVGSGKLLWNNKEYRSQFLRAFPYEDSTRIDTFEIMNALGTYIRSLVFLNSRFDTYMRGQATMNESEINGFNLFMGRAKCATCHYMPLFNGTFPPRFNKIESEVIGVPDNKQKNKIDGDLGRYEIIKDESFKHAFKTSTVRNAALTAPYMHNGVFKTLEEVMDFYNKGGGQGFGIHLENQTLPFDSLNLTNKEQSDIIAFIKSLDSQVPKN